MRPHCVSTVWRGPVHPIPSRILGDSFPSIRNDAIQAPSTGSGRGPGIQDGIGWGRVDAVGSVGGEDSPWILERSWMTGVTSERGQTLNAPKSMGALAAILIEQITRAQRPAELIRFRACRCQRASPRIRSPHPASIVNDLDATPLRFPSPSNPSASRLRAIFRSASSRSGLNAGVPPSVSSSSTKPSAW